MEGVQRLQGVAVDKGDVVFAPQTGVVGEVLVDAAAALVTANCQLAGVDTIVRTNRGLELRDWTKWCPPVAPATP